MIRYVFILILLGFLVGCAEQEKKQEPSSIQTVTMESGNFASEADSIQVISLPAPMQIPAVLRNTSAIYNKDVLFPSNLTDKSFFRSTILFGMYMVDLAYVGAFNDQQAARAYFNNCKRIGDDLGLGYEFNSKLYDQFENSLNKPDSVGHIIMKMYGVGHEYFRQNDKEGIGLLMILGCFFEGMHLSFEEAQSKDLVLFMHIMHQHQIYSENLILALDYFDIPSEIQREHEILIETNKLLSQLNAPSANQIETGQGSINQANLEVVDELKKLTFEFRQSMEI